MLELREKAACARQGELELVGETAAPELAAGRPASLYTAPWPAGALPVGLVNLGQTCAFNAVAQFLAHGAPREVARAAPGEVALALASIPRTGVPGERRSV